MMHNLQSIGWIDRASGKGKCSIVIRQMLARAVVQSTINCSIALTLCFGVFYTRSMLLFCVCNNVVSVRAGSIKYVACCATPRAAGKESSYIHIHSAAAKTLLFPLVMLIRC